MRPGHGLRTANRATQFAVGVETLAQLLINPIARAVPSLQLRAELTVGNHGRFGNKGEFLKVEDSEDYLFYQMLRERCRGLSNVEFRLPDEWWIYFTIYGHHVFAEHGDALHGAGRRPAGAVANRKEAATQLVNGPVDLHIMGHIHTSLTISQMYGYAIVNGCWPGTTDYAAELGYGCLPLQKLLYITPQNPLMACFEILLTERQQFLTVTPRELVALNTTKLPKSKARSQEISVPLEVAYA